MEQKKNNRILELLYQLLLIEVERKHKENTNGQNQ